MTKPKIDKRKERFTAISNCTNHKHFMQEVEVGVMERVEERDGHAWEVVTLREERL